MIDEDAALPALAVKDDPVGTATAVLVIVDVGTVELGAERGAVG